MTQIILVNRADTTVEWSDYSGNLKTLLESVEDKDDSVVICEGLPAEWGEHFESMGRTGLEVAWVKFNTPSEHFYIGFIAWDQELMLAQVRRVGESILGGELESFEEDLQTRPTIH